ncbi:hypothetical protein MKW94_010041, partial [Papaver nudicaule]|nr:hypothetical protein [Papaver nudicaule]
MFIHTQGDFAPSRVNSTSHLKILQQIKGGLNDEYLEIFKKTSIGHLLDLEDPKLSGAVVNSLLRRVLEPLVGDDPDSIYLRIGGKVVKYGMRESALMTGLSFKGSDVIRHRAESELINKYFPGQKCIKLEQLSKKFDSVEQSMGKVKLGLVLLVQGVLMGAEYVKDVKPAYFHMVENIKKFNEFPWGKLCHRRMLRCFRTVVSGKNEVEQIRKSKTNPKRKAAIAGNKSFKSAYNLYGFPYAFQVWAFESIPLLRRSFASRSNSKQLPRMLHYSCNSVRPESTAVENILTSKKIEVLACTKPTEGEMASNYMGSVFLMSDDLSESEDDDEDKAEKMEVSLEMQFANEGWEAAKNKDDGAEARAPQSCYNQDSQLLRAVFTQVKELTSKVSRMDEEMSKLKDSDNHNNQDSIEMEVIDEDERQKGLADDLGEEVFKAVMTVLLEMNDYSPGVRYTVPEWRNFRNGGMELLKEVASFTLEQWRTVKKRLENDKEIKKINKMQQNHKNHLERINREHFAMKKSNLEMVRARDQKIAAETKRLKEDLLKGRTELEKDMARDNLELEFEASNYKITEMGEPLEKKERQHEDLENLYQILIAKERKSNDELQEAREELTRELREMPSRASIGVKRMGELDVKPFYDMCKRKYCNDEANVKAVEICTSWEVCLRNPHWHPFKIIEVGNNHQ